MYGAGNEIRTRDLNLGKVALYQLSYSRVKGCALWGMALFVSTGSRPDLVCLGVTIRLLASMDAPSIVFKICTLEENRLGAIS